MSHSKEVRQQQKPNAYKEDIQWFAKAFCQPKTRRDLSSESINKLEAMIWENPADDVLPSYGKSP